MLNKKNIFTIVLSTVFLFTNTCLFAAQTRINSKTNVSVIEGLQQKLAYYLKQEKQNGSPEVTYNLGVIYYKLRQYAHSKQQFFKLLSVDKYHLLAKYNLGLVAYKSGETGLAIKWFKYISSHSHQFKTSDKIIALAKTQLAKLTAIKSISLHNKTNKHTKPRKAERLKGYVFAYYGHADNLSDPTGIVASVEDNFLNVYASLTMNLDDVLAKGVSWNIALYSKKYTSLSSYDYQFISTDFGQLYKVGNWRHSAHLRLENSTYGPDDYQSTVRAEFKTQYRKSKHKLSARYRIYDITSDAIKYNDYEGSRQNLYFRYDWSHAASKFRLGLDFETNDRADDLNATDSSIIDHSYSPSRKKIELVWFYKINKKWKTQLKFDYRDSVYNDFSNADSAVREETLSRNNIQLKYRLKRNWWLVSDYGYTNNESNIASYSYTRDVIRIGVTGSF